MPEVYWLEQSAAEVPPGNDWLGDTEKIREEGFRFAKRRADWRLGRWTAKRALTAYLNTRFDCRALAQIEIRAATDGAPEAFIGDIPSMLTISLSHCSGKAICAVAGAAGAVGCDIETIEERSEAFAADYFTPEEQALVARTSECDRTRQLTLLWSAKESVLKALRQGLRLDTRSVIIRPDSAWDPHLEGLTSWQAFDAWHDGRDFHGWYQHSGKLVRTVIAIPASRSPIWLEIRA